MSVSLPTRTASIATAALIALQLALATGAQAAQRGETGLPLPRFVSLKSERVNMRVGPGETYKVEWMYMKRGLPMEIIQEYDNWRKVRDPQGSEGWILHSLLSGNRTAIVAPWEQTSSATMIEMRARGDLDAGVVAKLEPGVVTAVESCESGWCRLKAGGASGYVRQTLLWGVYPDETLDD